MSKNCKKISKDIDTLPGLKMPEAESKHKSPTKPCLDCPYYNGTYSYFDDRTDKNFPMNHEYSDEELEHLKVVDYDDSKGDYVNCGVFENRDVRKCECNRSCDRDIGDMVEMTVGDFRTLAFLSGMEDPLQSEYSDLPHKDELRKITNGKI